MSELRIGERLYVVPAMSAMATFRMQPLIAPAMAEAFGAVGDLLGDVKSLQDLGALDVVKTLPAVGRFFSKMPPDSLEYVLRQLLGQASCNGEPLFGGALGDRFNILMMGRTVETWQLLLYALKVNYPDFLGVLAASGGRLKARPSEESSISAAPGPAGASS